MRSDDLFLADRFTAAPLVDADVPELQMFFDANPEYFLSVGGEPPRSDEARNEFDDLPPAGMRFGRKWILGIRNEQRKLIGFAVLFSDFLAAGVWHIGLFIVATNLHGTGAAKSIYVALESWMISHGAAWVRLGAVDGNVNAERFWAARGYLEVRKRTGIRTASRINTVRVLVKSLRGGRQSEYLSLVGRDRPESTLP